VNATAYIINLWFYTGYTTQRFRGYHDFTTVADTNIKERIGTRRESFPSSVPLPALASRSVCEPLALALEPPSTLAPDVLDPIAGGFPLAVAALRLTADVSGLDT
jgi:hypothetical protein